MLFDQQVWLGPDGLLSPRTDSQVCIHHASLLVLGARIVSYSVVEIMYKQGLCMLFNAF